MTGSASLVRDLQSMRGGLLAALAVSVAVWAPASAQEASPPRVEANPLCDVHGDGCSAPPAQWTWHRLEPRVGGYSVEVPCDAGQADRFSQLLAISRANFPAGYTRACMKAAAGFSATLIGFSAVPDDGVPPDLEAMMRGAPDLFTAFVQQGVARGVPETVFKGRRALITNIERADRRSKVALVEVGQFGVILLTADIDSDFPGTREDADVAVERFFQSLEFAE